MTKETEKITHFELLPGAIFIAPGDAPKDEATDARYYVGTTVGGVEIAIKENIFPIRDMSGNTVCEIRSGARLEVRGKLASLTPAALMRLFGARRVADGEFEIAASPSARSYGVSIVCPICGSEETFALYLRASTDGKSTLKLSGVGQDMFEFSLVSECDFGKRAARVSVGRAVERQGA